MQYARRRQTHQSTCSTLPHACQLQHARFMSVVPFGTFSLTCTVLASSDAVGGVAVGGAVAMGCTWSLRRRCVGRAGASSSSEGIPEDGVMRKPPVLFAGFLLAADGRVGSTTAASGLVSTLKRWRCRAGNRPGLVRRSKTEGPVRFGLTAASVSVAPPTATPASAALAVAVVVVVVGALVQAVARGGGGPLVKCWRRKGERPA